MQPELPRVASSLCLTSLCACGGGRLELAGRDGGGDEPLGLNTPDLPPPVNLGPADTATPLHPAAPARYCPLLLLLVVFCYCPFISSRCSSCSSCT